MNRVLGMVLLCLVAACVGEEKKKEQIATRQKSDTPMGAWFMYAGSETGVLCGNVWREVQRVVADDVSVAVVVNNHVHLGDSGQFCQAPSSICPVMKSEDSHRLFKGVVREGQLFGDGADRARGRGPSADH